MNENDYWFKKRMEDIPKPITLGKASLTPEQLKKGEEDLKRLIEESTGKKVE